MATPDKVRNVFQTLLASKEHNFELVSQQRSATGDFEIAAVVADTADEREAGFVPLAIDDNLKLIQGIEGAGEAAHVVSKLAESRFEIQIQMVDNFGVEAGARHTEEAARIGAADSQQTGSDADRAHSP